MTNTILIDINSVLAGERDQCNALLEYSYTHSNRDSLEEVDREQLLAILMELPLDAKLSLVDNASIFLSPNKILNQKCHATLKFCDQLYGNFLRNSKLHPDVKRQLHPLRRPLAISLLEGALPWNDDYLSKLIKLVHQHFIGWQPELGRSTSKYLNDLTIALSGEYKESNSAKSIAYALHNIIEKDQKRIEKLESRIRDAEIGSLHAKHAHQLSARTLNQCMGGKKLPAAIVEFLQGSWRESMRLAIINHGKDSKEWKKMSVLTETLIWSFQPADLQDSKKRQDLLHSISELSEALQDQAIGLHHQNNIDEELAAIEQQHLKILKSEALTYAPFDLIDNSDPLISSTASISKNLLKKVVSLKEGQWFLFLSDEGDKRIKLSLKISTARQLLFTNFLGMKILQVSFDNFAYLLSSNAITPIESRDPLKATGEKILSTLFERRQSRKINKADDIEIENEIIRQQKRGRDEAKEKALLEAKLSLKAAKLAQQRAAKIAEKFSRGKKPERQLQKTKISIEKLNVGGKVEFTDENNEASICKLVAIIQSSVQYIFVDEKGIKRHTLSKAQLEEMLQTASVKIVSGGDTFEGTLEKVVSNLRNRKPS